MKNGSCFAGPGSPFRRIVNCMRRCRREARPKESDEGHTQRIGELLASWGRWPGHEANFPALGRLLWEMGKEKYERETRKSKRETGETKEVQSRKSKRES
jgi:hypothetical protein